MWWEVTGVGLATAEVLWVYDKLVGAASGPTPSSSVSL
jgi:hypothetical protein